MKKAKLILMLIILSFAITGLFNNSTELLNTNVASIEDIVDNGIVLAATPKTQTYRYGEAYGTLPKLTWQCHNFLGWFTEKTGGTQVTEQTTVNAASNISLYAHWETAHNYTNQRTDATYLQTPATCQNAATYYYSCASCPGFTTSSTFTSGEVGEHQFDGGSTCTICGDTKTSNLLHELVEVGDYVAYEANGVTSWKVFSIKDNVVEVISSDVAEDKTLIRVHIAATHSVSYYRESWSAWEIYNYKDSKYAYVARTLGFYATDYNNDGIYEDFMGELPGPDAQILVNNPSLQVSEDVWAADGYIGHYTMDGKVISTMYDEYCWYIKPDGSTSKELVFAYDSGSGTDYSPTKGYRPIVVLKKGITITGGDGSEANPWILGDIICNCCGQTSCDCSYTHVLCTQCGKCDNCCFSLFDSTPHTICCGSLSYTIEASGESTSCCGGTGDCTYTVYTCGTCGKQSTVVDCAAIVE